MKATAHPTKEEREKRTIRQQRGTHNIKGEDIKIKAKQKREINLEGKMALQKSKASHINMEYSMVAHKRNIQ